MNAGFKNAGLFLMIAICAMINLSVINAQENLSTEATISLLTCDPGSELYSTFGHSAIRVVDPVQNMDVVFNYGIFDFNTPGFYTKFLRGKLNYKLGAYKYASFLREYDVQERSVIEQKLNLDSTQREAVFDFLVDNAKPENRYYKYDFFFDNCSTRARDIFDDVLGLPMSKADSGKTFRDLLDEFLPGLVWSDFGIDLVIGAIADKQASQFHQTFLPEYLMVSTDEIAFTDSPLVESKSYIRDYQKQKEIRFTPPLFTPLLLFGLLFLLELVLSYFFFGKESRWVKMYDHLWFLIFGLAGALLMFMWFGTDHLATKQNWNLIWLSPLFLLVFFPKNQSFQKRLNLLLMVLIIIAVIAWPIIPQRFHIAFLPMMLTMLLKLWRRHRNLSVKTA